MWKEFKEFALRGNMIDLAIGLIIGVAFGAVINSLVNDILMPPIGMLLGNVDFADLFVSLNGQSYPSLVAAQEAGAPTLNYGLFINTLINFLIIALAVFLIVRMINRMRKPAPVTTKACPYCAVDIPLAAKRCPECTTVLEGTVPTGMD